MAGLSSPLSGQLNSITGEPFFSRFVFRRLTFQATLGI
jgi:hypothetical protein